MRTANQIKKDIENIPIGTRITKSMHNAVTSILTSDAHINMADYLRDLIRKDLREKGIVFPIEKKEF